MRWADMPSLSALRALDAVARHGSFSAAARSLNVTHAAIAQHVRAIEAQLKTRLVTREGRGVALTPDGVQLAAALADGFASLHAGVAALRDQQSGRPLALTTTPSFAEYWLMPRLSGFWAAHPGFSFSISPSLSLVDLRRDPFDMAIRYGDGSWPHVEATFLVSADYVVVAPPDLVAGRNATSVSDVTDLPWLFEAVHQESRLWAKEQGLDAACCQIKELGTLSMVLSALRAGAGVSVQARALVEDDIAAGRLTVIAEQKREGMGYYILTPDTGPTAQVRTLKKWLLSQS